MDELAEIAASVALALGLTHSAFAWWMRFEEVPDGAGEGVGGAGYEHRLFTDGSNVFADPWRWMCLEWLLEQGYSMEIFARPGGNSLLKRGFRWDTGCPAAEFPARAIHAIISAAAQEK